MQWHDRLRGMIRLLLASTLGGLTTMSCGHLFEQNVCDAHIAQVSGTSPALHTIHDLHGLAATIRDARDYTVTEFPDRLRIQRDFPQTDPHVAVQTPVPYLFELRTDPRNSTVHLTVTVEESCDVPLTTLRTRLRLMISDLPLTPDQRSELLSLVTVEERRSKKSVTDL